MRCEDIAIELDAYSTGELDAETRAEIEQHIRQCPSCLDELARLRDENILYRNYATSITGIAGYAPENNDDGHSTRIIPVRYAPPESRRRAFSISGWGWAAAAIIIMAIGLSWYLQTYRNSSDIGDSIAAEQLEITSMDQALKDLEQAIGLLQASYLEKKPRFDPELVEEFDRNLEITRTAINECKEALKKDSGNRKATEFLAFSYQKQIDILRYFSEGLQ